MKLNISPLAAALVKESLEGPPVSYVGVSRNWLMLSVGGERSPEMVGVFVGLNARPHPVLIHMDGTVRVELAARHLGRPPDAMFSLGAEEDVDQVVDWLVGWVERIEKAQGPESTQVHPGGVEEGRVRGDRDRHPPGSTEWWKANGWSGSSTTWGAQ